MIRKYYHSTDLDYKDHIISAIGGLGMSSGRFFLKQIIPVLDDDMASVAYIALSQLATGEKDLLFVLDDLSGKPGFQLWSNLFIVVEMFKKIQISNVILEKLSKYEPLPAPRQVIP